MRVLLDAGEFHYLEYGDPAAPPMVLLHGLGADSSTWAEVAPALGADHHIFALDQRGHGGSVRTGRYSFEEMREDVRQLADRLGLERFLLCGHSMGGTVATLFAERYSDRLTGLVLVDTPPPDGRGEWKVPPQPEGELDFDWPVIPAIYGQLAEPDPAWWSDLPRISVPTLVLGGGSTSPVPQDLLAKAAELIPDAALITVEGAGHTVQRTRPTELLAAIRTLLVRMEQVGR